MHWILGLLTIAVSASSAAAAQQDRTSANFLLPHCKDFVSESRRTATFAKGFTEGICAGSITAFAFVGRNLRDESRFCLPGGAHSQQAP